MIEFVNLMEGISLSPDYERLEEFWNSNIYIFEPIPHGRRYQCLISDSINFLSRSVENKSNLINKRIPHIIQELKNKKLSNVLLDGYITNGNYLETLKILAVADNDLAIKLQKNRNLLFIICDIIYFNNVPIYEESLFDRKKILKNEIEESSNVKICEYFYNDKFENYKKIKDEFDSFYFKDLDSIYLFTKSKKWRIFKNPKSFFVIMMGICEGQGKNENSIGAIKIGQYNKNGELIYISNVGGLDNDEKQMFFYNKDKYIGNVIEIKALEKTKKSFKEPRFFKIRNDIDPKTCQMEE